MKSFLVSLIFIPAFLIAQTRTENFIIKPAETRISNSLYNKIILVDLRDDTSHFGIVQKGAFNTKAFVVPKIPLAVQLSEYLISKIDTTANDGELALVLRQMSFAEITTMSERGYYFLRADLFARQNDEFYSVAEIDTVIMIRSMDVTKPLLRAGETSITSFINNALKKPATLQRGMNLYQLNHLDSIHKSELALYTVGKFTNGVYTSYSSFKKQLPDTLQFEVKQKKGLITEIRLPDKKGKFIKAEPSKFYAVVYEGIPYIATEFGYYVLEKKEDNFFYTGKYKASANQAGVIMAGAMFGILGGLIAAESGSKLTGELKLDYISGHFKPVILSPTQADKSR